MVPTPTPEYGAAELAACRNEPGWRHARFGDLNRPGAVCLTGDGAVPVRERTPFYVHVSVTSACNAACTGCINSCITSSSRARFQFEQVEPERDARAVAALLADVADAEAVVCLYGGEPLLSRERLHAFVEALGRQAVRQRVRFMLYTNGQLLGEALAERGTFFAELWLLSVSLDGTADQHERLRPGTDFAAITGHLERLRAVRQGTVLMWSTLREASSLSDCFAAFCELHARGLVDQWFWHWLEAPDPFADLPAYGRRYEADLARILEAAVDALRAGRLLPVVHLNELILYLATGQARGATACGVEEGRNYDILGGRIHACADLPLDYALGEIAPDGTATVCEGDLQGLVAYKADLGCDACGVHPYCGGRCPVQALTSQARRLVEYCQLMRLHVGVVQEHWPALRDALARAGLSLQDVYDQSAFWCQFTDVTP